MRFESIENIGNDEYRISFKTTSKAEVNKALNNDSVFAFTEEEIESIKEPVALNLYESSDEDLDIEDISIEQSETETTIRVDDEVYTVARGKDDYDESILLALLYACNFTREDLLYILDKVKRVGDVDDGESKE